MALLQLLSFFRGLEMGEALALQATQGVTRSSPGRRDGLPLVQDLCRSALGHDFAPEQRDDDSKSIREGWPKTAEQYPPGYSVATPPGDSRIDCMYIILL